jgi:hypothetical protein
MKQFVPLAVIATFALGLIGVWVFSQLSDESVAAQVTDTPTPIPGPPNDQPENAQLMTNLPFSASQDTTYANANGASCGGMGADVWYKFTAPSHMDITANTLGSTNDAVLAAYAEAPGAPPPQGPLLSPIACNDDSTGGSYSSLSFSVAAGKTVYFQVGGFFAATGNVSLSVQLADSDGDGFSNAVEISVGTDPFQSCGIDAWPADIDNSGFSDTGDIGQITAWFGQAVPPSPARVNIAPDPPNGFVDTGDIGRITGLFGRSCTSL